MSDSASDDADGPGPRATGAVQNCVAEAAYHVTEAKRLFNELLAARTPKGEPVVQIVCSRDGSSRRHINVLRHHLEEALTNVTRENTYLRRLRLDQEVFQDLFTENLRFHQDFLLENRRVASAREALHIALKEQAKLNEDLATERSKSRKMEKEQRKFKRQFEEMQEELGHLQQQLQRLQSKRATENRRTTESHPAISASSVLERLVQGQAENRQTSTTSQSDEVAVGAARKRPRVETGDALVGKVVNKEFDDAGVFWGEIVDYDSSTELYRVAYEDGDREDFELDELDGLIVESASWRLSDRARQKALAEVAQESSRSRQYLDRQGNGHGQHR